MKEFIVFLTIVTTTIIIIGYTLQAIVEGTVRLLGQ